MFKVNAHPLPMRSVWVKLEFDFAKKKGNMLGQSGWTGRTL